VLHVSRFVLYRQWWGLETRTGGGEGGDVVLLSDGCLCLTGAESDGLAVGIITIWVRLLSYRQRIGSRAVALWLRIVWGSGLALL